MLTQCLPPRFRSIRFTVQEQILNEDFQAGRHDNHYEYDSDSPAIRI